MRLIAMLLALWANHHPNSIDRWRRPDLFLRYLDWICNWLPARNVQYSLLQLIVTLLPPLVLFAIVQVMLDDWLLGVAEIALGAWALLFLHGPGRTDDQFDSFAEAWRDGHFGTARNQAAELAERSIDEEINNNHLPILAAEGLLWQSYRRLLSGIFWLLIIGPVGPFAVRLVVLTHEAASLRNDGLAQYSRTLLHLIDWLPARAAALSFALAGSFVQAREAWLDAHKTHPDSRNLVVSSGIGALDCDDPIEDPDDMEELMRSARELVSRSLLIWIAVAALLTIAGWLY